MNMTMGPAAFLNTYSHVLRMQLRNLQAFVSAQQKLFECSGLLATEQAQFVQALAHRLSDSNDGRPATPLSLNATLCARIDDLKTSIMEGQAGANAVSEIIARSGAEATEVLQNRFMAALDELKGMIPGDIPDLSDQSAPSLIKLKVA